MLGLGLGSGLVGLGLALLLAQPACVAPLRHAAGVAGGAPEDLPDGALERTVEHELHQHLWLGVGVRLSYPRPNPKLNPRHGA